MSPSSQRRTAVLLDPHPLWLDAVETVLSRIDVDVVGKTASAEKALALVGEHAPDVLITEIQGVDDIAVLVRAQERNPRLKCIVLSMYADRDHVDAAFSAGAAAYVVKTAHPDDLASAIRQAFQHSVYLAGARFTRAAPVQEPAREAGGLTRRELEILKLVAEGHSNAQLARMLWVTEQTVKFHLSNIYRKLDVANRTEAARWAQLHGVLGAQPVELSVA